MVNVEVVKTGNENALSTIRKFTQRVRGANIVKTVRSQRYFSRATSQIVKKKHTLKLIKRRQEYRQMIKEGKIAEHEPRRGHAHRAIQATKPATPKPGLEGTPIAR